MADFDYLPPVALISSTSALSHGAQRNLALSSMTQTQITCGDFCRSRLGPGDPPHCNAGEDLSLYSLTFHNGGPLPSLCKA